MTEKHPEVIKNGSHYQVTAPTGLSFTFDDSDKDLVYVESLLYALSRWLDFVVDERKNDGEDSCS